MENENLFSNNEVVENVENTSIVEETILEDNTLEVLGNNIASSTVDNSFIEEKLTNIDTNLLGLTNFTCSILTVFLFFLISFFLLVSIHFITERRKV